jgi:hypothetical protein
MRYQFRQSSELALEVIRVEKRGSTNFVKKGNVGQKQSKQPNLKSQTHGEIKPIQPKEDQPKKNGSRTTLTLKQGQGTVLLATNVPAQRGSILSVDFALV